MDFTGFLDKSRHLKGHLRHIDATATSERSREKKRSRFSSSENKRTSRRGGRDAREESANGVVCFGCPIGGQDFQERIINFPCHSAAPTNPFRSAPRKSPEPRRQYCWPFRSTVPERLRRFSSARNRTEKGVTLRTSNRNQSRPPPSSYPSWRRASLFEAHTDPSISAPVIKHNRSTFGIRYIYVMDLSLISARTPSRRNAKGCVCVSVCIGIRTIS